MSHSISSRRATGRAHTPRTPAQRHLRLAWVFVVLIPFAFAAAMVVGEGLLSAAGYDGAETVPFDVVLRSAGPALLIMVAPPLGAVWYGLKARREGLPNGFVPAVVGATVAVVAVGANVASYVLGTLLD